MNQAMPNILVVEDDRETRTLIAKCLRTNSCNVTTASDGREMARAMADHRVDLLILDVMLPGEDDYLAKPFNPRELLARINAVLRRQAAARTASAVEGATALTFLGWRIDF